MERDTDSLLEDRPVRRGRGRGWALCVALDGDHLDAPPMRISLAGVSAVSIGRGPSRSVRRDGERVRLELDDGAVSKTHAELRRTGQGWTIADADSKNGTLIHGRRVALAELDDGAIIECGATFMVLRRAPGPVHDLPAPASAGRLATLSPIAAAAAAATPRPGVGRLSSAAAPAVRVAGHRAENGEEAPRRGAG